MLKIEINIQRPILTLVVFLAVTAGFCGGDLIVAFAKDYYRATAQAVGGFDYKQSIAESQDSIQKLRTEQMLLKQKESILRQQLQTIQNQKNLAAGQNPALENSYLKSINMLLALLKDSRLSEQKLLESYRQMWEAERLAESLAFSGQIEDIQISWPVAPSLGISAYFKDQKYLKRFGFEHKAIDIPIAQDSAFYAAADGVVKIISDNDLGYSYLIIEHDGFSTLYGHVSEFLAEEGQTVSRGDLIGKTGGMPGTKGAGQITTGPHMHFELIINGEHSDPLAYLPDRGVFVKK